MDLADICKDKEAEMLIFQECNAMGKKSGFKTIEILMGVVLAPEEWTPQTGLVTPAQKLQRKKIEERFSAEINVGGRLFAALVAARALMMPSRMYIRVASEMI